MKDEKEIFEIVRRIVSNKAELDESAITMDSDYREHLDISSVVMVSIILAVEIEFGFEIEDEEIVDMTTVGDAVSFVSRKLKEQESAA